jgi:hypothetical protein
MDRFGEYRLGYNECLRAAHKAPHDSDRARWLKLAMLFLTLLPQRATSDEEAFSAEQEARGTGQEVSTSAH